jgi:hypothetical protein
MDPTLDDFTDTDGVIGALRRAADGLGVPFIDAQRWLEGQFDLIGPAFDHPVPEGNQGHGREAGGRPFYAGRVSPAGG